jgi:uncharacterized membrane protein
MLNRSKLLAAVLLVAVFAAGAAVGAAVFAERSDQADGRRPRDAASGERRERPRERSYIGWLEAELALSPAQRDTVSRILDGYQGAMSEIWSEVRPRMDSIRTRIRGQILLVLDSAQQDRYRVLTARSDSSRRQERTREGGRDDNEERSRDKRDESGEPRLW